VRVVVHPDAPLPQAGTAEETFSAVLRPGTPMSEVGAAVRRANADARLVEIGAADLRRLCKWLGSTEQNAAFNALQRYVLHESARCRPAGGEGRREGRRLTVRRVPCVGTALWRSSFAAAACTSAPPCHARSGVCM